MNIPGISNSILGSGLLPDLDGPRVRESSTPPEGVSRNQVAARPAVSPGNETVPAEAPPGTDPALWSVLSPAERSYFARMRSMGPLTYGPGSGNSGAPGVVQGGRIDVRV